MGLRSFRKSIERLALRESALICAVVFGSLLGGRTASAGDAASTITIANPRCEYAIDPIGIDVRLPRFSWQLQSSNRGEKQTAYQILVAGSPELLARDQGDKWDSGRVASDNSTHVTYAGELLRSREQCFWKVRVWNHANTPSEFSSPARFEMGLLERTDWEAKWIASGGGDRSAAPLLRRSFSVEGEVRRARAYVAAAGWYELSLNGHKVGDHVLDPASTYYTNDQPWPLKDRALYVTYDITDQLRSGPNAVGVMLGNGWYSAAGAPPGRQIYGDRPRLLVQLIIEYADGRIGHVATDESWKCTAGPVTANEICLGETYDARREVTDWDSSDYEDATWDSVAVVPATSPNLSAQMLPPCRVIETRKAISIAEPAPGVFVCDFGQHMSGWTRIRVSGSAGTKVKLRHAGRVNADGSVDVRNNLAAAQTDTYILRGHGEEIWEPRFTLHGFRYVEVTGLSQKPALDAVEARHVRSDIPIAGEFDCSNALINRIHSNVRWTLATSLQGIPQDAAERQERMGWLGDSGFLIDDYMLNFDGASFWTKWLREIQDAQRPNGNVPVIAPLHLGRVPQMSEDKAWRLAPDWTATYPLVVWSMYWRYGDERILAEHYDSLKRLVTYYESKAENYILPTVLGDHMEPQADGSPSFLPKHTPPALTCTCYYFRVATIMADAACVLHREDDARKYDALAARIKTAFQTKFFDAEKNIYGTGSQASLAAPLAFNLVPEQHRPGVIRNLVDEIVIRQGGRVSTGMIGTKALVDALPLCDRADVLYTIATQTKYPSWGHQIANGATTIHETWEGGPTFSLNMKMFASISKFFYENLAGIQPASAGYRTVLIKPCVVGDLHSVRATLNTIRGPVEVNWNRADKTHSLEVLIPPGSTATVHVPTLGHRKVAISESGRPVWREGSSVESVDGIKLLNRRGDAIVLKVTSGRFRFEMRPFE